MNSSKIPFLIGVTGHRNIRESDVETLYLTVKSILKDFIDRYPNTPIQMMNSLAEGSDLLCADVAASLGIPLIVVLPTNADEYSASFSQADKKRFHSHLTNAESVLISPETEERIPSISERDYRFRQAGIYISTHCQLLIALWDGDMTQKDGCGSAAAVNFMLTGSYNPKEGVPNRPAKASMVYHVLTPRSDTGEAGELQKLGDYESFSEILSRTDEFNRLSESQKKQGYSLFEQVEVPSKVHMLDNLYSSSDQLSIRYAKRYRLVLALMALFGTLLTLSFLLYDEAELHWMILATGAALLLMFISHRYAVRSACHRRYLEYRVLAESLRVQAFLKYAGSELDVPSLMPLIQQEETTWIVSALSALSAVRIDPVPHSIRDLWIVNQRDYHAKAIQKSRIKRAGSDRIVSVALILSASIYVIALILELTLFGTFFPSLAQPSSPDLYRTVIKIILGGLSAGTLFIANYYGKQSLVRVETDHIKMQHFFDQILSLIDRQGQNDKILKHLAREELNENGNWYSYQSNNTPDIDL